MRQIVRGQDVTRAAQFLNKCAILILVLVIAATHKYVAAVDLLISEIYALPCAVSSGVFPGPLSMF